MRLPGQKLAVRSFRWTRSRILGGVVVLGYHRLHHGGEDPYGLAIPLDLFEAQIALIARRARPIRLTEAVEALASGRLPSRGIVITFDDGYADTVEEALPVLERSGVPATVFVTTGSPGRHFWWDELADIVLGPPSLPARLDLEVGGARHGWSIASTPDGQAPNGRTALLHSLASVLRGLNAADRCATLRRLRTWSAREPSQPSPHRALTPDEIRRLAASPLIEIGAHSVSHPALTFLPDAEQREEIAESRARLEAITERRVTSFSYPHGSYAGSTISAVRDAGFTAACCSTPDVMTVRSNVYALPRLWVEPQDPGRFERWLDRWLAD